MNFLQYRNAEDLLKQTEWDVETALSVVKSEILKLKAEVGG